MVLFNQCSPSLTPDQWYLGIPHNKKESSPIIKEGGNYINAKEKKTERKRGYQTGKVFSFHFSFCNWGGTSLWILPGLILHWQDKAQLCFVLFWLLYKSKVGLQEKCSAQRDCPFDIWEFWSTGCRVYIRDPRSWRIWENTSINITPVSLDFIFAALLLK